MTRAARWGRRSTRGDAGAAPVSHRRKWLAIMLATLLFVPAHWAVLTALVAAVSDSANAPSPGPALALGLGLLPFVFIVLAFVSEHPRAPGGVLRAMLLSVAIGAPVTALTGDLVTGLVAGVGAGGVMALRADAVHSIRARALAVGIVATYTFVLTHTVGVVGVLGAPILPFTAIGIADHISERRAERANV